MSKYLGKKYTSVQPVKLGKSILLWHANGQPSSGRRCVIIASATQVLITSPALPNGVNVWLPGLQGLFTSPMDFATFQGSETGARVTAQTKIQDYRLSKYSAVNYYDIQKTHLIRDVVTIRNRNHHTPPTLYQLVAMLYKAGYTYKEIYCPLNSTLAPKPPQPAPQTHSFKLASEKDPYDDFH